MIDLYTISKKCWCPKNASTQRLGVESQENFHLLIIQCTKCGAKWKDIIPVENNVLEE